MCATCGGSCNHRWPLLTLTFDLHVNVWSLNLNSVQLPTGTELGNLFNISAVTSLFPKRTISLVEVNKANISFLYNGGTFSDQHADVNTK